MTTETAAQLRRRLRVLGLDNSTIQAAWPRWWSQEADASVAARTDLRFSLARNLGLDPRSLFGKEQPRFVWRDEARFKHLSTSQESERTAITSFAKAIGNLLIASTPSLAPWEAMPAATIRRLLLDRRPFIRLVDLLGFSWSAGIPVIHLRVFPQQQKRMAAMTVRLGDRFAILLARDSLYPASLAFYLSHELAHISLRHLDRGQVLVDFEEERLSLGDSDLEEAGADQFALELLTGESQPVIVSSNPAPTARELGRVALGSAADLAIEPGAIALSFGYSTGQWDVANRALDFIYSSKKPAWREVNDVARMQLHVSALPGDSTDFLDNVMGPPSG